MKNAYQRRVKKKKKKSGRSGTYKGPLASAPWKLATPAKTRHGEKVEEDLACIENDRMAWKPIIYISTKVISKDEVGKEQKDEPPSIRAIIEAERAERQECRPHPCRR